MLMAHTVVVLKRAHFFSIDNDIIDVHAKTIGALGIAIYAVLARYANRRTGECWPAIARIQRTLKLGRSSVKRYLHRLEAAGLITVEERWSEDGDRTSNLYTLLNPEPAAIAERHQTTSAAPSRAPGYCEGGGSTETPPPVLADEEGGSTPNPQEPDPQNLKKETTYDAAALEKTHRQLTCTHPLPERSSIDGMTLCYHCWSIVEDTNVVATHSEVHRCPDKPDASQAA
jgi:DNA-binding MarR family transcriptional regulator